MRAYGKTAKVRYPRHLADGTVFDSTEGNEPLEFVVGSGEVIHGFDEAVASMEVGESRHVVMPACDAFGERLEEKVELAPMYAIPNAKDIEVGRLFYFVTEEGLRFPAKVLEVARAWRASTSTIRWPARSWRSTSSLWASGNEVRRAQLLGCARGSMLDRPYRSMSLNDISSKSRVSGSSKSSPSSLRAFSKR